MRLLPDHLRMRPAIGYVRVSTRKQAASGAGFNRQSEAIRDFAAKQGLKLRKILVEEGSASCPTNLSNRSVLKELLETAKAEDALVLVFDQSRISRHEESFRLLVDTDLPEIISITDFEKSGQVGISPESIRHHEAVARSIGAGTRIGMERGRSSGQTYGSLQGLEIGRKTSIETRSCKKLETIRAIADVLRMLPNPHDRKAIVRALSAFGILSGWGKPFTLKNLSRPLAEARRILAAETAHDGSLEKRPSFGLF